MEKSNFAKKLSTNCFPMKRFVLYTVLKVSDTSVGLHSFLWITVQAFKVFPGVSENPRFQVACIPCLPIVYAVVSFSEHYVSSVLTKGFPVANNTVLYVSSPSFEVKYGLHVKFLFVFEIYCLLV